MAPGHQEKGPARRPFELEGEPALVEAFRRGAPAALERVFVAYAPSVEALLRSGFSYERAGHRGQFQGLRSSFDVEDHVHEVFARAFSAAGRSGWDGVHPFGAYLHGITRNLVLDGLRRAGRELPLSDEAHARRAAPEVDAASEPFAPARAPALEPSGRPARDAEDHELVGLVAEFRASLGPREAQVFTLRFEAEHAHPEIEADTGLTPSQIKTSEKHIRTALFRFLQARGYLERYTASPQGWLSRRGGAP